MDGVSHPTRVTHCCSPPIARGPPPSPSLVVRSEDVPRPLTPLLGQWYPQKAALGTTGMQGFASAGMGQPHPALTSVAIGSIHLFMYFFQALLGVKTIQGPLEADKI